MKNPVRILFNGHDFKFLTPVIDHCRADARYEVALDAHPGHVITQPDKSEKLLGRADIIFCEWCLGNAEWYSHHKRADQILVVRLHHQEVGLHYLDTIDWSRVDTIIFICQNNMALFLDKFPEMKERSVLIYNPIDCSALNQEKLTGAEFNLGFIGTAPKRKAPHLAFEIFSRLKKIDTRYTLFFKGKQPWEYDWVWRRAEERQYYEAFYATINQSAYVNAVVFDPFGNDIPDWFSKLGFLLSTSDHEGSHQAVAEAMAAGTIPVLRNWDGADALYPERFVFTNVDEAVELILESRTLDRYAVEKAEVKRYAQHNFDQQVIIQQYEQLFENLISQR